MGDQHLVGDSHRQTTTGAVSILLSFLKTNFRLEFLKVEAGVNMHQTPLDGSERQFTKLITDREICSSKDKDSQLPLRLRH